MGGKGVFTVIGGGCQTIRTNTPGTASHVTARGGSAPPPRQTAPSCRSRLPPIHREGRRGTTRGTHLAVSSQTGGVGAGVPADGAAPGATVDAPGGDGATDARDKSSHVARRALTARQPSGWGAAGPPPATSESRDTRRTPGPPFAACAAAGDTAASSSAAAPGTSGGATAAARNQAPRVLQAMPTGRAAAAHAERCPDAEPSGNRTGR